MFWKGAPDETASDRLMARLSQEARVVEAGSRQYDAAREQFATHLKDAGHAEHQLAPSLIVQPATEEDVGEVIRFACETGHQLVARSGGHQYSGLSSAPRDAGPSIQIDLASFGDVVLPQAAEANRVDPGTPDVETVRVVLGAGARLRNVYRILARYHLVLPGGVCVDVGIGGHLQSSAMGMLGRSLGLGLECVRRIRIALAETGHIVDATAEHHPDLFWALLGGSPGAFGVVIAYEVEVYNARCFPAAYGVRHTWEFTEPVFRKHLETLLRITSLPAYDQRRDATIYLSVNRSLFHPYLAGDPGAASPQHITLMIAWTGIDSGPIHGPMPEALRGDHPAGSSFYDALVAPFLDAAPPLDDVISYELDYARDPECDLANIAMKLTAPNIVGSLDDNWREIAPLISDSAEEEHQRTHATRAGAEAAGINWRTESARYIPAARFSFEPMPEGFIDACLVQLRRMREVPELGCVLQLLPMGGQLFKDPGTIAFTQRDVHWGYDLWALWRGSLGVEVAEAAQAWIDETDAAFTALMGERTAKLLYCTCGELDIHNPAIRRLYYPDEAHFLRLRRVKGRYDPQDRFRSQFTVPPVPVDEPIPAGEPGPLPVAEGLRLPARARFRTIVIRMLENAGANPDKPFLTWIDDDGSHRPPVTYGQFRDEVTDRARWMRTKLQMGPGDRVLICYPPGTEFAFAFMACQMLGAIPIATYVFDPAKDDRHRRAFLHIHADSRPRFVLTSRAFDLRRRMALGARDALQGVPWVVPGKLPGGVLVVPEAGRDDVALIQYTSGTTGPARGVALTQENLLRQFLLSADALNSDEDSRALGWMPQAHDFGLISTMMLAMVSNVSLAMMSPFAFVKRPTLWFESIERFGATHTAAPNFAYGLVLARTTPEERAQWDLSSLEVLMSAAEPIEPDLMEAFYEAYEPAGLSRTTFAPAYGLVELTVGATMGGGHIARVDPEALSLGRAVACEEGEPLWSSGRANKHLMLEIVAGGQPQAPGGVGEIWLDGPCRSPGFLGPDGHIHPEVSRLPGRSQSWVRSGDLGFMLNDELFVLCRAADVVRVDGRWVYPPLVERAVARSLDWARPGSAVAHQTPDGRLGLIVEVDRRRSADIDADRLLADLAAAASGYGGLLGGLAIAERGFVLKTTSGKRRRTATARRLFDRDAEALLVARQRLG